MTKAELEKLLSQKREMDDLFVEIQNLPAVGDFTGSVGKFPYTKHHTAIQKLNENLREQKQKELDDLATKYSEKIACFELWLEMVPDARMRMILRMRYRQGMSYGEIGNAFNPQYERSTVARRIRTFLEAL